MAQTVRLFLVDDEPDVTDSLRWLLHTVGLEAMAFNDPSDFLRLLPDMSEPCCVILDLRMPGLSGIEVLETVVREKSETPVVVLSGHGDVPTAVRAMKLGAFDFLMKPFNPQGFLDCVNRACRRAEETHRAGCARRENEAALARLSTREQQIFDWLVSGMSSKEIGRSLQISPKTVDVHRASIMKKVGVATSRELLRRFGRSLPLSQD